MKRVKVGVIGCGKISQAYLRYCTGVYSDVLEVVACADVLPEAAQRRAEEFGITALSAQELLANPEVQLVVNLTVPAAHASINLAALQAGKHIYVEKPFATSREEAKEVLAAARSKGLLVGGAPDTFLGSGLQTCRKLIDEGYIGQPLGASGSILMRSAAYGTHPNPAFFLQAGAGPLLDMGPYYVTAMVALLGPVRRVTGSAQTVFSELTVQNPESPRYGEKLKVEVPTNVSAVLDFASGAIGSLTTANDSFGYHPRLEIYGTEGILTANDPNMFSGNITLKSVSGKTEEFLPRLNTAEEGRGLGIADMAKALLEGSPHRVSGELAYHVLDTMLGIYDASAEGKHYLLETSCDRPARLDEAANASA